MTNEELIAGFLDRSLSEDQLVHLESLQSSDPAFATELRQMVAIEDALLSSAPVVVAPTDFLARVEDTVAANITSSASTSTLASISTAWKVVGAAAITVGTAVGIYYGALAPASRPEPVKPAPTVPSVYSPAPNSAAPSLRMDAPPASIPAAAPSTRTSTQKPAEPAVESPAADGSMNAYTKSTDGVLVKLEKEFEVCRANRNRTRCAQLAVLIGAKHRSLKNYDDAQRYYNEALSIARSMHIVQYEVEALGGLGMVSLDLGNSQEARSFLRNAIESAAGVDGVSTEAYRRTLESLGN